MSHEYPDFPDPRRPRPDPDSEKTYFQDQTPQEYLDQTTQKYSQLHTSYNVFTKKEISIQITGMIFIFFSLILEFAVYLWVRKILPFVRPNLVWKLIYIFIVVFIITILAMGQFIIIYRWNKRADRMSSSSSSLTLVNYRLVDQIRTMILLVSIILFFSLSYYYLYNQYQLPPLDQVAPIYRRVVNTTSFLLRVSWVITTSYFILEIWQLIRWMQRNSAVRRLEQRIIEEIPNFNELADITDFTDDS
ncbi:MAG: hypothetical protein ACTSWW_05595 [Promethearchaeota archaeon]